MVDGTGRPPRRADVLIQGERIAAVGEQLAIPPQARIIRAEGQTLIPGLFDLHTHLPYSSVSGAGADWGKHLKAYLACGVTSVVDFGVYPEMFEPIRRLVKQRLIQAPRLHLAARLTTPGGHGAEGGRGDRFTLEVLTPREARAAIAQLTAYQPDVIKVFTDGWRYGSAPDMTSMDEATLRAIVEQAHQAGWEVLTHTVTLEKAKIAARAGVDVIAHGIGDAPADDELVRLLRDNGVTYAPTLAVYEPAARRPPPLIELLDPSARAALKARARSSSESESRNRRWMHLIGNVAALRQAGVRFGAGTDAGVTGTHHGISTLRELELLVEGGLTPLEAIQAATSNAARALHVDGTRGTIEAGKLADLVLIDGAPHLDIRDIRKVSRVFLGGEELDRKALLAAIASSEMTPIAARAVAASIDDFEQPERTRLGTLRVNQTDPGHDHTRMLYGRILRAPGNHAVSITARFSEKDRPYARLVLPLTPGSVEPADVSAYGGVRFEARGDGQYRLLILLRSIDGRALTAPFRASAAWSTIAIPFSSLEYPGGGKPRGWDRKNLLGLAFELSGQPGEFGWLELDNVVFYR